MLHLLHSVSMKVTVLLFASVADAVGKRKIELDAVEGARIADVRDQLLERYPALARFAPNLLYALDEEYADLSTIVPPGATLALIPPVSGGQACCSG